MTLVNKGQLGGSSRQGTVQLVGQSRPLASGRPLGIRRSQDGMGWRQPAPCLPPDGLIPDVPHGQVSPDTSTGCNSGGADEAHLDQAIVRKAGPCRPRGRRRAGDTLVGPINRSASSCQQDRHAARDGTQATEGRRVLASPQRLPWHLAMVPPREPRAGSRPEQCGDLLGRSDCRMIGGRARSYLVIANARSVSSSAGTTLE